MGGNVVVQAIAAVLALALYFLPSILADRRKRHDLLTLALFQCVPRLDRVRLATRTLLGDAAQPAEERGR